MLKSSLFALFARLLRVWTSSRTIEQVHTGFVVDDREYAVYRPGRVPRRLREESADSFIIAPRPSRNTRASYTHSAARLRICPSQRNARTPLVWGEEPPWSARTIASRFEPNRARGDDAAHSTRPTAPKRPRKLAPTRAPRAGDIRGRQRMRARRGVGRGARGGCRSGLLLCGETSVGLAVCQC